MQDGLAQAYDRYADSLYKYCRFMLSDPADAADTVQDTFVIAGTWTGGLGDQDLLRARLYAVARNACLTARRSGKTAATASENAGDAGDAKGAEGAEPRILLEDAGGGLAPAEREIIELHVAHGLEAADLATVLGVSGRRANRVLAGAMDQLQACLGVLLVGRAASADCARLASMLDGWDGTLTPALRWWVHWHIKKCATCGARSTAELGPATLPGLSASAAMTAAAQEGLRRAPGPPAALKEHTLALATGQDPSAVAYRAVLLSRTEAVGQPGLLAALRERMGGPRPAGKARTSRRLRTAAAACVVLGVVGAAVTAAMTGSAAPVKLAGGTPPLPGPTAPAASAPGTGAPVTAAPATSRPAAPRTPHAAKPTLARVPPPVPPSATPTAPVATPPGANPTPTPTHSPAPAPTTASPAPPGPTHPPSPPAGTLTVSPSGGNLRVTPFGAIIRLTAQGGPVQWSVTVSSGAGRVIVRPASGTLQPGHSAVVAVFASSYASGRQLTVSPGGTVFTIVTGWGHRLVAISLDARVGVAGTGCGEADEAQHRAGGPGTGCSGYRVRRPRHEPAVHRPDGLQPV